MSTPVTPTASRKRAFNQTAGVTESTNEGTGGSWLGALGGVVGEWLQGWGLLGVLRRRSGVGGVRSTPNTPPTHSQPTSPSHEHIELRQLNFQCGEKKGGGGGDREERGGGGGEEGVVMRRKGPRYPNLPQGHLRRPTRHSYHEGSTPESYILTALLIHSLKHKPGSKCPDSNCPLPPPGHPKGTAGPGKGAGGVDGGAEGGYVRSVSESEEGEAEKCMRPKIMLSLEDYDMSPLSSPSSAFQFAQISPLPSPHSAMTHASSSTSSLLPGPSSSSLSSSYRTESETTRPPDSDTSSFYDVSSLTDVTFDSSVMSLNAETLSLSSATLVDASFPSESRETYSELESSTFPKVSRTLPSRHLFTLYLPV
ncbi:putative protein TPRXL [Portunus trituberculatus]|uniref:putative protein TPRXL n=1 Tax=Portunus trituberculatus TaxID=210409 RepID=UPI001E1D19BD|nr:putative protein TPRXL [Portunus trituberculatus]XP_045112606.1 putative protein TPRXL [Portunus trituberculatus]